MRIEDTKNLSDLEALEVIADIVGYDWSDNCQDEDQQHELYDNMLDDCCTCETCGKGGSNLKEDDPIAYRGGFSDWLDSTISNGGYIEIGGEYLIQSDFEAAKEDIASIIQDMSN